MGIFLADPTYTLSIWRLKEKMRIQSIRIHSWRHFEDIELTLPDSAPIICIVGGNGTGKSQILELIAACSQQIGLAPGTESSRGNPFGEVAHFEITFSIAKGTVPALDAPDGPLKGTDDIPLPWDRSLTVQRRLSGEVTIRAGGVGEALCLSLASKIVDTIRQSASVHYLALDADRAYPKVQFPTHELGQAFERDWDATLKQSSFKITRNLYDEWFRFLIGKENRDNNRHVQQIRLARERGQFEPVFVDQFDGYKSALKKVLPHLLFIGIEPQSREIKFDSTGIPLSFDQLSGGEREIAFLVGQIERFSLRKGLLLVDEPELHLNYDLLRSWIGYLKASVEQGQIWLATHSLEVVEVTGQEATFILERNANTRKVTKASSLNSQPVVATLSRAIGSPAFSISNLAFVLIEGEEEIGERERFRLLAEISPHVRFLEAGSCKEVVRRIAELKQLADESGQQIRIGGIVDGDWRSRPEREELTRQGVLVLDVHEVENLFLHPPTLEELMRMLGRNPAEAANAVREAADRRAGSWIFDAARTDRAFAEYPVPAKTTRELVHRLCWNDFAEVATQCEQISKSDLDLTADQSALLARHLEARARIYARTRESDLWRTCEGKEVFRAILAPLGLSDEDAAERAITAVWLRRQDLVSDELRALRTYIAAL